MAKRTVVITKFVSQWSDHTGPFKSERMVREWRTFSKRGGNRLGMGSASCNSQVGLRGFKKKLPFENGPMARVRRAFGKLKEVIVE